LLVHSRTFNEVTLTIRQAELAAMEPKKENGNGDAEEDAPADTVSAAVSEHDELEDTPAPSEADHEEPPHITIIRTSRKIPSSSKRPTSSCKSRRRSSNQTGA